MERFKSVLVEGAGNPLQTMAAYIDLNPVRAGLVEDPKDYRFCGYAEAVAHSRAATASTTSPVLVGYRSQWQAGPGALWGIRYIWSAYADGSLREGLSAETAMQAHRELIFGKRAGAGGLSSADRNKALKVLEQENAMLPRSTVLRCRVRYFTDGAILGSEEFVRRLAGRWQADRGRKYAPKIRAVNGANWGDLAVVARLRKSVFL
jgi:hypothetical protein